MSDDRCGEDVTRQGESQPCDRPAVALRIDPEFGDPYPVCAYHSRARMVPLAAVIRDAKAEARAQVIAELRAKFGVTNRAADYLDRAASPSEGGTDRG